MHESVLELRSPAKVNLFLLLFQQREDGFHELLTLFQLIDLCDEIEIQTTDTGGIIVDNPSVDCQSTDDLCYRAAKLLQEYSGTIQGAIIRVLKRIPQGGGLAGGSSNAATVLLGLNKLWGLGLPQPVLLRLALQLGSDVPVFVYGKSTLAAGRGELFLPTPDDLLFNNRALIVVNPNAHVSTGEVFSAKQLTKRSQKQKMCDLRTQLFVNDFTDVVFLKNPRIKTLAQSFEPQLKMHLTGTGASLYTVLDVDKKADKIVSDLRGDYQVFACKAIDKSPLWAM